MTLLDDRAFMDHIDAQADLASLADVDVEQALIGAILVKNDLYGRVANTVKVEHFSDELHRRIWHVASSMIEKGHVANALTMRTLLGNAEVAPGMTIPQYLARLMSDVATLDGVTDYARIVGALAARKELCAFGQDTMRIALDPPVEADLADLVSQAEDKLAAIRRRIPAAHEDFEDFEAVSERALRQLCDDWRDGGKSKGFSTGFPQLDEMTGGLEAPDLIILAGRPGAGKTAAATNIAFSVAQRFKIEAGDGKPKRVGFFSIEMSKDQLWQRILSESSDVPSSRMKKRDLTQDDVEMIVAAEREIRKLPLDIDASGKLTIAQLEMRARNRKKTRGLDLLIIDYVQLIKGRERRSREDNRVQELTDITTSLKNLAKELNVPIIALAQVGRQVEMRDDRRPRLSDLRESGSIENDADIVLFIYREEYYLRQSEPPKGTAAYGEWLRALNRVRGQAEVIVAKQRHGSTGSVLMGFDGATTRFLDRPPEREDDEPAEAPAPKKKPALSGESAILYGVLKSLSISHGAVPTAEQKVADRSLNKNARLVSIDRAREAFAREAYAKSEVDDDVKKKFTTAFQGLRKHEIAFYTGADPDWRAWLPEMCEG